MLAGAALGCAGPTSDGEQHAVNMSSGETSGVEPPFTDSGDQPTLDTGSTELSPPASGSSEETDAELVLQRYDLLAAVGYRPGERELVRKAWEVVFRQCAAESGYTLPLTEIPEGEYDPQLAIDRLRFNDLDRIRTEGYRFLFGEVFVARPGEVEEEEDVPADAVAIPLDVEDACRGRSNEAFGQGRTAGAADRPIEDAQADIITHLQSAPDLVGLKQAWASCMDTLGFAGLQYDDMGRITRFLENPTVTAEEAATATADASCRQETGYTEARLDMLEAEVTAWLAANNGIAIEVRDVIDQEVATAKQIIESS